MKLLSIVAAAGLVVSFPAFANLELAQKNGCLACHGVDKKIVGPAYKEVAAKYSGEAGAEARLFAKVKSGGKGVWGQIPMPPNPKVTDADLKKIISWVLSMK